MSQSTEDIVMPAPFAPSVTRTDLRLARLPTGPARQRLRTLGHRAAEIFHGLARNLADPARRRRAGLMAELCDALGLALNEVAILERALEATRRQLGDLQQAVARSEAAAEFARDVHTKTRDTRDLLPFTLPTSQIDAQHGGES